MNSIILLLHLLSSFAHVVFNFSTKNMNIIDFDLVKDFQNTMEGKDKKESDAAFDIYIQTAGFDDLLDNYKKKIQVVIDKRLQEALILKK